MGAIFGGGAARAAREQARATREAAEAQARQARESARAAQQQSESTIARQRAAEAAKALEEGQTRQTVELDVAPEAQTTADDAERRRRPRDVFRVPGRTGVGLNV